MASNHLWGEFENTSEKKFNYASLIEEAKSANFLEAYNINVTNENITLAHKDDQMVHTIKLHQYSNLMKDLIKSAEASTKTGSSVLFEAQTVPKPSEIELKYKPNVPFRFIPKQSSDFTTGKGEEPLMINEDIRKHLLQQSAAILFAQIGFEETTTNILSILQDVLDEFLTRICLLLRTSVDTIELGYSDGFPDELERVLIESGVGGMKSIHDYYNNRVINYQSALQSNCEDLFNQYEKIRFEMQMHQDEVPEIHLQGMEEDHSELQPSLQSGFQMLQSLEQEVDFQNIEYQDFEINISMTDFPSTSDYDSNNSQSPYNKLRK